jgi:hypothetical protein
MFIHVSIMIFVGFGFLMTFLKRYGYSAIGYNFMLSCFAFLWNVLVRFPRSLLTFAATVSCRLYCTVRGVLGTRLPPQL